MEKKLAFVLVLGVLLFIINAYNNVHATSISSDNLVWKIQKSYISKYVNVWVGKSNENCYIVRTEPTPQLLQIYNDFKTMQTQAFKQKYSYLSDYANKKGRNIMADMNSLDKFPIKKLGKFVLKKVGHSKQTGTIDLFQPNFIEFCGDAKVGDNVEIGFASINITLVNASAQVTIDPYIADCLQKCEHDIYITNLESYNINISKNDFSIVKASGMGDYNIKAYLPYNVTITKYNTTNVTNVYNYTENFTKTDLENCQTNASANLSNETWCLSCWDNGDNETYSCNETVYTPYNVEQTAYKFMSFDSLTIQPNETKHLKIYYDVEINSKGKWDFYFIFNNESYYIDPWWNSSWQYRKPITITEQSGNDLTNFQVAINISYDSGMQSDFDDLRFTYYNVTSDSEIEIPYWIESYSASEWCYVWVNVTYIPANDNATIYMYYGNTEVSNESNGDNTFILFDDFEGTSLDTDKWTNKVGTWTVSDGKLVAPSVAGARIGTVNEQITGTYNITIEANVTMISSSTYGDFRLFTWNTSTGDKAYTYALERIGNSYSKPIEIASSYQGATYGANKVDNPPAGIYEVINETLLNYGTHYKIIFTATQGNETISFDNIWLNNTMNCQFGFHEWDDKGYLRVDWVRIRKYADPEPTYTIGSEEPLLILTVTSPTNTTYNTNQITVSGNTTTSANITYSLNGGANQTLCINCTSFSNTTTAIEGQNYIAIYAVKYDDSTITDSEVIYFTVDTIPPAITIHSPLNQTYTTSTIWLNVTADETVDTWMYNLNDAGNVSFTPNITITAQEGQNKITVWANDTAGNWNSSTVYFRVDTIPPLITIVSPDNITYNVDSVWANITVSETADWCAYSLDGAENITMNGYGTAWYKYLTSLSEGQHNITFWCNDTVGNYNSSIVRYFSIDITSPIITIHSPTNTTYNSTVILLNTTANENIDTWIYNLNDGGNVTFTPPTVIIAQEGSNHLVIYANDTAGNMGTAEVYFTVTITTITQTVFTTLAGGGGAIVVLEPFMETEDIVAEIPLGMCIIKETNVVSNFASWVHVRPLVKKVNISIWNINKWENESTLFLNYGNNTIRFKICGLEEGNETGVIEIKRIFNIVTINQSIPEIQYINVYINVTSENVVKQTSRIVGKMIVNPNIPIIVYFIFVGILAIVYYYTRVRKKKIW